MGLTLGLSTALSGLLTSQKGLDVISQNVVNVNTKGYVRKVMTPESVTVNGMGAGVQTGKILRSVDEGLLQDIRRQTSTQGNLDALAQYYPRIMDMFGQVADNNSISHQLQTLQSSFQAMAAQINTPAMQTGVMQTALDTANQFDQMTQSLQDLRLEADRSLQTVVGLANEQIANIFDLNQKIVRAAAIGTEVGDLEDKRDNSLTELAKYMDIQYFPRGDGSVGVYTKSGETLVDKGAATLSHVATTITDAWMTKAGGNFNSITVSTDDDGGDLTGAFGDGEIKALIDLRDKIVPDLQAQIDELASKMKEVVNQVHNRGTTFPTIRSTMSGTRQFMDPNNPSINAGIPAGLVADPQTIWLSGNDDVTIAIFDTSGVEVASTTLRTIMASNAYNDAASAATALDISDTPATPGVKLTDVAAKIENWMKAQTYQNNTLSGATASFTTGKFELGTGHNSLSLAFRDQVSSVKGATAGDATINFDPDGDGVADLTVEGFSNFFGLNDMFTKDVPNSISDSNILDQDFALSKTRTIRLLDPSGQIGNAISIPTGSNLASIATAINNQTQTNESSTLATAAITGMTSNATITLYDSYGVITGFPKTIPSATTDNLNDIAAILDGVGGSVQAKVVQTGPNAFKLRVWDSRGVPLTMAVDGGTIGSSTLGTYLGMQPASLVQATVIPDGSGYRLRIRQTDDQELFVAADQDNGTPPTSFITEMGMRASASRSAGNLSVRTDIQGSPSLISRGAVKYNADLDQYALSEGDNTTTMAIADAMASKSSMASAGNIYAGSYNFVEYAAASISVVSTNSAHATDQLTYQKSLGDALSNQNTSFSGVNLDEEVANMINFQQAYSAAAKVISTLQQMLDTLVNIIQ